MNDTANMTLSALRDQWGERADFAAELAGTVAFDDSLMGEASGERSGERSGEDRDQPSALL